MVTTHDERQVRCPVTAAALAVLETYSDIVTDIYGNPEERPMVLTQEHRTRFCAVVTEFYDAILTHGVPFAHDDLRPYGGTAARGAAHALSKKLQYTRFFLEAPRSEAPRELTSLLDGAISITWWAELLRDQARPARFTCAVDADRTESLAEEQVVGWPRITALLGFPPKDRRGKELVERLNRETHGPIKQMSKRTVVVGRESLMAWWRLLREQEQDTETKLRVSDRDSAVRDEHLSNPGVRKDDGFQLQNRRGS